MGSTSKTKQKRLPGGIIVVVRDAKSGRWKLRSGDRKRRVEAIKSDDAETERVAKDAREKRGVLGLSSGT